MTLSEKMDLYFRATGKEITEEAAAIVLKDEDSMWFKKLVKMAKPTIWQDLKGKYNVGINPLEHEGMK